MNAFRILVQLPRLLMIVCCLATTGAAQLPTIALSSLSQPAMQIGTSSELRLAGSHVDELQTLRFSNPQLSAQPQLSPPRLLQDVGEPNNAFNVSVDPSAAAGLVDVWAWGRFGISNPRRLLLCQQPVQLVAGEHAGTSTAIAMLPGKILADRCVPQQRNFFRLALASGQRLRCCAYARAIDSQAALNMFLLDEQSAELSRSRAVGSWPAEFEYTAPHAQEVFIVVHDFLFRGGEEYSFVLEAQLSDSQGGLPGLELDNLLRPRLGAGSPTASPTQPEELQPPFTFAGNLSQGVQEVKFSATGQQLLSIQVQSASLDQLTDPVLEIYQVNPADAQAKQLLSLDDVPTLGGPAIRIRRLDPRLVWKVPQDATYHIVLRDNQAGQRPADATDFLLTVQPAAPSFRLLAYRPFPNNNPASSRPIGASLMRGGTEAIHVLAIREDDFSGPIELTVDSLPAGVSCAPAQIGSGESEATLILRCADDAQPWQGPLQIVGRAVVDEQARLVPATAATIVWPATGSHNAIEHRSSSELLVAINALDEAPLLVELGDDSLIEVAQGAKASIPIKLTRRAGGNVECLLRPQSLPPKTTLGEIKIAADANQGSAELNVAADAPPGDYSFWLQNEIKVKMQLNPQSLAREEAYLGRLTAAAESASEEERAALNEAIAAATASVEELKKQSAEREFSAWLPSTSQTIRITPKPES